LNKGKIEITYLIHSSESSLNDSDKELVLRSRELTSTAYAPYSSFHVSAVARMENGTLFHGTNQENASFPAGLCAERVLLAVISSVSPDDLIDTMAITYSSNLVKDDYPLAPCGICRQSLIEYEARFNKKIRLLLTGRIGLIYEISSVSDILPFGFRPDNLIG
jgi:cytidine deaminase